MKLELKNIEYSEWASEETSCYQATVYKDGKLFCHVKNDGKGGCDMQCPIPPNTQADIQSVDKWLGENMPKRNMSIFNMADIPEDLETWCNDQMVEYLFDLDLKKRLAGRVVYLNGNGELKQVRLKGKRKLSDAEVQRLADAVRKEQPDAKILNNMPFSEAKRLYFGS